jgi:hypothetical protein
VGDPATGKLYEQSLNYYDDDGVPIQYLRAFPHLLNEDRYHFHHRFEAYMETGTVKAGDPEMMSDWIGVTTADTRSCPSRSFRVPARMETSPSASSGAAWDEAATACTALACKGRPK